MHFVPTAFIVIFCWGFLFPTATEGQLTTVNVDHDDFLTQADLKAGHFNGQAFDLSAKTVFEINGGAIDSLGDPFDFAGSTINVNSWGILYSDFPDSGSSISNVVLNLFDRSVVSERYVCESSDISIFGGTVGTSFECSGGSTLCLFEGQIGSLFSATGGSSVNVVAEGDIGESIRIVDDSSLNLFGGNCGSAIVANSSCLRVLSGNIDGVNVTNDSHIEISGGFVSSFLLNERSSANVAGGVVGLCDVGTGGTFNFSDGYLNVILIRSGSEATVCGGFIHEPVNLLGGKMTLSGGDLAGITASSDSTLNLFGTQFIVNGTPLNLEIGESVQIDATNFDLQAALLDGSPFAADDSTFSLDVTINVARDSRFGDINQDSNLDLLDVVPFIAALIAEDPVADINKDGEVTLLDVFPFIELLM